jgi:cellobiose phosphorylase
MYRLMVESLLGLRLEGTHLRLAPCIPPDWPGYRMRYRHGDAVYRIHVRQLDAGAEPRLTLDGVDQAGLVIPLQDDHAEHIVEAWVARR